MTTKKAIIFNISFWLLAAFVMFVESWPRARSHIDVAIVRYLYFPLIGLLVTFAITNFYKGAHFQRKKQRLWLVVMASVIAAILTAILLNPITYLMVGYKIQEAPHEILSTGTLYFALIYFVWAALYFQLTGQSILKGGLQASQDPGRVFRVEKMGEKRLLQDRDICCITANGDYVELVTASNSYMIKDTLANLEDKLDGHRFKRVHRSTIVNKEKIESVVQKPGGAFEITLDGGQVIQSSRSYKIVVESILPRA